ncbi:MAG TPA: copper-transporting ATPase, partial [Streptomyces sp.]|nr:copper-transporting ATPase [Streptomyces sp.]
GRVTVASAGPPDDDLIAKVVDDAGYEVTGRA